MTHYFMSYDRDDQKHLDGLCALLNSNGLEVWRDVSGLTPGTPDWQMKIEKAIEQAGSLLVVLSPNAKESKWVRLEVRYADIMGKTVVPIMVGGDERTSVPIELVNCQWLDYRLGNKEQADRLVTELKRIAYVVLRRRCVEQIVSVLAYLRTNPQGRRKHVGMFLLDRLLDSKTGRVEGYSAVMTGSDGEILLGDIKRPTGKILTPEREAYLKAAGWEQRDSVLGGYRYERTWQPFSLYYATEPLDPDDPDVIREDAEVADEMLQTYERLGLDISGTLFTINF